MEKHENLIILRNILYKCFVVGFILFIVAILLYLPCKCYVANVYLTSFRISPETYDNLWVGFGGLIKVILVFLFLVPGLAVHWVAYDWGKKHKDVEL